MFTRLLRRRVLPVDEEVDGGRALDPGIDIDASLHGPDGSNDDLVIELAQAEDEAELTPVERLLLDPPKGCRDTAAMWEQSRRAGLQTSISARELFAYWIYRSNLHEVERRRLDEIYAQFDSETLKTLSQAVREFRENPVAVEDYVDSLRKAELETSET